MESPQSCLGRSFYSSSNGCPAFPYAPQTGHPCVVGSCVYWQHPCAGGLVGVTHPDAHLRLSQGAVAQGCLNPFPCLLPVLYLSVSLCSDSPPPPAPRAQLCLAGGIIYFIQSEQYLKPPVPFKVPNDGITPTWVLKLCQRGFLGIIIP